MVCSGDKAPWHGAESAFVAGRAPPPPTGDALGSATAVTTSLAARLSCSGLSFLAEVLGGASSVVGSIIGGMPGGRNTGSHGRTHRLTRTSVFCVGGLA